MHRLHRNVLGVIALLLAATGAAWAASGRERSLAIYPAQNIPLRFDHGQHLAAGADCAACHDSVRGSESARDRNLPGHEECEVCHDLEAAQKGKKTDPASDCAVCHPGFDATVRKEPVKLEFPHANLNFSHKQHVAKKVECAACHGDLAAVNLATRQQLPKMATCFDCHDGRVLTNDCTSCHLKQASGRLQLNFTSGILRPIQGDPLGMDHGPRFEFNHGTRASVSRQTCMECHSDSYCQKCHDSLQKPLSVHPNDFITLHPVQARTEASRCESCHRSQSFCIACHERSGVGMDADSTLRPRNVKVHPDYNIWVEVPGPQHHGIAASRDMRACISCHREESCMSCHSELSERRQINPHPNGFKDACKRLASANDRACLKCHSESSLAQKGCR
ncbi:cytochrome c3 family protein [Stigmatella aurantiaca]|uniref:Cytochrome n=1 Tax=Stigmatella aurantiaca (strain DW4/3-1) TaxID=378806 RepID=Q08ZK9_STIAD|nr:cytochrome c3 family protein [Stigmatella aurantiaca]ADO71513.1 Cytochrome [Stigmatella aurantiaca DW4/3-1]EAU65913.1 cytochrome c, NapC/NirT family, putative [Stigmatella aurantiaca DW4/3-1]